MKISLMGSLRLAALCPVALHTAQGRSASCPTAKDDALLQVSRHKLDRAVGALGSEGTSSDGDNVHEGVEEVEHRFLGCFPRAPSDSDDEHEYEDRTCVNASRFSADDPCRSGLPFFRRLLYEGESYLDCFTLCLSKGLDLSGVITSARAGRSECRCGATPENRAAWHMKAPLASLLLAAGGPVLDDDPSCSLLVWQYTGHFENSGVPFPLMSAASAQDVEYMDEISDSRESVNEEDEPLSVDSSPAQQLDLHVNLSGLALLGSRGLCLDSERTGLWVQDRNGGKRELSCPEAKPYCEGAYASSVKSACPWSCGTCSGKGAWLSCYPDNCGPGRGPWLTEKKGKVKINYYFESYVDKTRRAVFKQATELWEEATCARFVPSRDPPTIRVAITDLEKCSASLGYPGPDGTADINLGWCNSTRHIGSIAHEIGHVLGMNHEHKRPDAAVDPSQPYQTPAGPKGPYLRMFWDVIPDDWLSQYRADSRSYIGSKTAGYSPYDYESLMHYHRNGRFETVDPKFNNVVGSRSGLSQGDIAQFEDMYQCSLGNAGAATTAPGRVGSSTSTTNPPPGNGGCEDDANFKGIWNDTCETWVQWVADKFPCDAYVKESPALLTSCPVACGVCTPQPAPCRDDPVAEFRGVPCAKWSVWVKNGDVECDWYSSVLASTCPKTCGKC